MTPALVRFLIKIVASAGFAFAVVGLTHDWTLGFVLFASFGIGYNMGLFDAQEAYDNDEY